MELENKYATLLRKHKKLKARYNDLYIEDQEPEAPTFTPQQSQEPPHEELAPPQMQQQVEEQPPTQYAAPQVRRGNWRSMLMHN